MDLVARKPEFVVCSNEVVPSGFETKNIHMAC